MRYQANFYGRKNGAIGITFPISAIVEGENKEKAEIALYKEWEHISRLTLTEIEEKKEE